MFKKFPILFFLLTFSQITFAQCPVASFSVDDSIPSGSPLNLVNNSTAAQEYHWDFTTGELDSAAQASVLTVSFPAYEMKIVEDNGNYYAFVINYGGTQITRLDFGNSPSNAPVTTPLPNNGFTTTSTGIDMVKEGNKWYGFVSDYSQNTLYKLDFDSITQLAPVITNIPVTGINVAYQVRAFEHFVFMSSFNTGKIVPLDFGGSYANNPTQLPDITGLSNPVGIDMGYDERTSTYTGFVTEVGRISRLDFGNSLATNPVITPVYTNAVGFIYGIDLLRDGKNWYLLAVTGSGHLVTMKSNETLNSTFSIVHDTDMGVLSGTLVGISTIKEGSTWHGFINNTVNAFYHFTYQNVNECNPVSSTAATPAAIYNVTKPGFRYVELKAINTISHCERYYVDSVFVRVAPVVNFTASEACFNTPVYFTDSTTALADSIISWTWNFGDSTTSNLQNPSHLYADTGSYTVTLTVQSYYGYTVTDTVTVIMGSLPVADFTFADSSCNNIPVQFTDASSAGAFPLSAWSWSFGNGDSSSQSNPAFGFDSSGVHAVTLTITDQRGCVSSAVKNITTVASPEAEFAAIHTCINETTQFQNLTDSTSVSGVTYAWTFGNMQTSTDVEPVQVFTADSLYEVILIASGSNGCADTMIHYVDVARKPEPAFTFTPSAACTGNSVHFTDTSIPQSGDVISYRNWDFGDTVFVLNDSTPDHSYSNSGTYNITLTVATGSFCDTSVIHSLVVAESPSAGFTATTACFGNAVAFNNTSSPAPGDPIAYYMMYFGDSITGGTPDTSYIYTAPGVYNVSLVAVSQTGCVDSVTVPTETFVNPVSAFTYYPLLCTDTAAAFVNLSSIAGDTISSYLWSFGDGDTSSAENPTHVYQNAATVAVTLTVFSDEGCFNDFTDILTINQSPSPSISYTTTCFGESTCFTYIENNNPPNNITSWLWTFGDNTFSTVAAPCHTFSNPGTYNALLQVQDNHGCRSYAPSQVIINALPLADFTNSSPCTNSTIAFTDVSSVAMGTIVDWSWQFGTSAVSSLQNPGFSSASAGLIPVTLVVTSNALCTDTTTEYIYVNTAPSGLFTMSPIISAPGEEVNFTNTSVFADSFTWNFGDGTDSSYNASPVHAYQDTGTFTITLITTNNNGCNDTTYLLHHVADSRPDMSVLDIEHIRKGDFMEVSAWLFNGGNTDITHFDISLSIDGVNTLLESPDIYIPFASSPKWFTFNTKVKLNSNDEPGYLCVEVTEPNGLSDVNPSDNLLCKGTGVEFDILSVLPNPASEQSEIRFNMKEKGVAIIRIYSQSGELVFATETGALQKGYNSYRIRTASWAKGIYAVTLEVKDTIKVRKLLKH